jgi:hypothetical protein
MPYTTQAVLQRHLQAAGESVDAVMADYLEESILITPTATHRGLAEIRLFFTELLEGGTKGFLGAFKMKRQEVTGDLGYIVWEARPWFSFATDTLLVRDGKIMLQTFSGHTDRGDRELVGSMMSGPAFATAVNGADGSAR